MRRTNTRSNVTTRGLKRGLEQAPTRWHETDTLFDGTPVARLGALWYVLDEDGEPVSDGHHEIIPRGDGKYEGVLGASEEPFSVDRSTSDSEEEVGTMPDEPVPVDEREGNGVWRIREGDRVSIEVTDTSWVGVSGEVIEIIDSKEDMSHEWVIDSQGREYRMTVLDGVFGPSAPFLTRVPEDEDDHAVLSYVSEVSIHVEG